MEEVEKEYIENYENYRTEIVSFIGFLLGVKDEIIETEADRFKVEYINKYKNDEQCLIIRYLSIIRMNLIHNTKEITTRLNDLIVLEKMPDLICVEAIKFLRKKNIEIVKVNATVNEIIAYLNQYMLDNIEKIKNYIPNWIQWEYIRNLFLMPSCYSGNNGIYLSSVMNKKKIIRTINTEKSVYFLNRSFYPYGVYLYWPENRMKPYYGNILFNDEKFLKILYTQYDETFKANQYVIDAPIEKKNQVYTFLEEAINVCVLVDCENVDPYCFASVFMNLDEEKLKKIKKVVLFDDVNASNAWDYLDHNIKLPLEHREVSRVLENKSLVDIAMTTGACKEFYENNTESIILASSDSDFWGLVSSLPTAKFLVLNESTKASNTILRVLKDHNIQYCFMDWFAQAEAQEYKEEVLVQNLRLILKEFNETGNFTYKNPDEFVDAVFSRAHIKGPFTQIQNEKETFKNKYLKKGFTIKPLSKENQINYVLEIIK